MMATPNLEIIVDGDGHVVEDLAAIVERMPKAYQEISHRPIRDPFPPLDHLHAANLHSLPPHSFAQVGVDGWVDFLEDVGIDTTVLYTTRGLAVGKIINREWAIDVCRAYNDWIYETYMTRSPRFKAMGLIPMQEPEAAAVELRRIVTEYGMPGAMLPSTGLKAHLGSKEFDVVYAEADRLGCALGVHGGAHENFGMDDLNPYAPVHALGHPFGQMISFAGIVFNGIFDKYPNVRFGFLEAGVAWFLLCLERFDRSWETHIQWDPREEYIRLQDGESISEYIKRHMKAGRIYVGCEGDEPQLGYACRTFGNEAFFYSSDFPHEVNNEYCKEELREMLENPDMTAEDKAAVLHGNARRFYRLS